MLSVNSCVSGHKLQAAKCTTVWLPNQQHSTAQHSTAQHSTAQHSTAQHSTAQHAAETDHTCQGSSAEGTPRVALLFEPCLGNLIHLEISSSVTAGLTAGTAAACPCSDAKSAADEVAEAAAAALLLTLVTVLCGIAAAAMSISAAPAYMIGLSSINDTMNMP